jgi:hypothetical protein
MGASVKRETANIRKDQLLPRFSEENYARGTYRVMSPGWRLFLAAKLDRAWSALTQLRAKVGAARFRDLMVDLPDALDEVGSRALGAVAEFHDLLGGEDFHDFLAEVTDGLEAGSDPGVLWAKWIEFICGGTPS